MLEKIQNLGKGLGHFLIPELLKNGLIVDGGANVGKFISKIRQLGISTKILAIEPGKENFYKLTSSDFKNVDFLNKVLVDSNLARNPIYFNEIKDLPEWGSVKDLYLKDPRVKHSKKSTYLVEPITLLEILKTYGKVDYLKMDIEGCESDVVLELSEEISKNITQISFEVHNKDGEELRKHLSGIGYMSIFKNGEVYGVRTDETSSSNKS